ncbi:MAG: glycosyltransferase family 1 protein [Deltaproteobacteria bacterium]|nr:glycosyltransferase family 1 protein [Deltaproteobacteria bacterium]
MTAPLRIGILTDGLEERFSDGVAAIANGGVGVYIHELVTHLRRIDPVNQYFTVRFGRGRLDLYRGAHARQHVALRQTHWNQLTYRVDGPYRHLDFDVLHYPNQLGGAFLPRRQRRVVTLHDITPLLFPHTHPRLRVLGYRVLIRRSLARADHVIVDATHTAADLLSRGLITPERVSVIPLAAAPRFAPVAASAGFARRYAPPERYILTVGVLEPRKNHATLLEALHRLHAQGEPLHLEIVGKDGWHWRDPLAEPRHAALRPFVRIHRNVPDADLPEFYSRAAVFAYPSLYEGFGLPLVEAMACGAPVVASRASSLPEVAGDAALFADPHDPAELAAQLLAVLRDAPLRARLRAAGQQRSAELTWQRTAERTRAVYERVCGRA